MTREIYCEVVAQVAGFFGTKTAVTVDFGQSRSFWQSLTGAQSMLNDPTTGKPRVFNSLIDGLNFMASKGWVFVNAYVVTVKNQNIYHYIMKTTVAE